MLHGHSSVFGDVVPKGDIAPGSDSVCGNASVTAALLSIGQRRAAAAAAPSEKQSVAKRSASEPVGFWLEQTSGASEPVPLSASGTSEPFPLSDRKVIPCHSLGGGTSEPFPLSASGITTLGL
jgi:hypothetical protein